MLTDKDEMSYKASEKPDGIAYHNIVSYADWMNGAVLSLHRSDYGCCNTLLARQDGRSDAIPRRFSPNWYSCSPRRKS